MHDAIISFLLPVLLAKVKQPSLNFAPGSTMGLHEEESRFLCLKIINDTLLTLLNEESIYLPHSDPASPSATTNIINGANPPSSTSNSGTTNASSSASS